MRILEREEAGHGAPSGETVPPFPISVTTNQGRGQPRIDQGIVRSATEVVKDMDKSLPLDNPPTFQELGEMADSKSNVRTGGGAEVAQGSDSAAEVDARRRNDLLAQRLHGQVVHLGTGALPQHDRSACCTI
jgi:hypothetical protein